MNTLKKQHGEYEELKVNTRLKLAALWTSFMFLYIYVDYFHLYMPGVLSDMLEGRVFTFQISQTFLSFVLTAVTIPSSMIFLSLALPAKLSRWINIVVATVHIPYMLFNLAGVVWVHMVIGAVVEVVFLLLIIRYAWKWPRIEKR